MAALDACRIAKIAEAAYRRGYQQGYTDGLDMIEVVDLHHWRYEVPLSLAPEPQKHLRGANTTSLSRLWIENGASYPRMDLPDT